jgi:Phosphate transporter family
LSNVGEKIGKEHLTYGQGAAAEITAMGTIGLADSFGLPVSTTHVLSSGVAGTMAANGSGIQMSTVRSILLAWVFTLPLRSPYQPFSSLCSGEYCKRKICWLLGALKCLCDGGRAEFPSCVEIFSAHPPDNL